MAKGLKETSGIAYTIVDLLLMTFIHVSKIKPTGVQSQINFEII